MYDNLQIIPDKPLGEIRQLCLTRKIRQSLNAALFLSIITKKENVAFDLVALSIEMGFSLTITER